MIVDKYYKHLNKDLVKILISKTCLKKKNYDLFRRKNNELATRNMAINYIVHKKRNFDLVTKKNPGNQYLIFKAG